MVLAIVVALPASAGSFEVFAAALGGQNHGFSSLTPTDWRLHAGRGERVGMDWFPFEHFSAQVSVGNENERMSLEGVREAKFHVIPASAIIQFHPLTQTIVQPYLGVGVSYLMFRGGVRTPYGTAAQPDHGALMSDFGIDYVASSHWRVMIGGEYGPARSTAEVLRSDGSVQKIDYHQFYITSGLRYRF